MNKTILFILIVISTSCATEKNIKTGGDWHGCNYSFFSPKYTFSERAKPNFIFNATGENSISLIQKEYNNVHNIAKKIIIDSCGDDLYSKVQFYDLDIVYWDSLSNFNLKDIDSTKCSTTKYFIRYILNYKKNKIYKFGIAFDKKYNIISSLDLPRMKQKEKLKIIKPKAALFKARFLTLSIFKKYNYIELTYNRIDDRFEYKWTCEFNKKKLMKSVTINATTGKLNKISVYRKPI